MLGDFRTEDDERAAAPRSHRRKDSGKSLIAMTLVVALFGLIGVGGWWGYNNVIKDMFFAEDYSGEGNGTEVEIVVEEGWFVSDIAQHLYEEGVVASAKAFTNASEDDGDSGQEIQPGTYRMQEEMSADAALAFMLDTANRALSGVTIIEGDTMMEAFTKMSDYTGVPYEDFVEAAKDPEALGVDSIWFEGFSEIQQKSVEGFLYPSTYEFDETMTAEEMLSAMVARFNQVIEDIGFLDKIAEIQDPDTDWAPDTIDWDQTYYPDLDGEFKIYPWMALQIASIVVSESGIATDDPKIAQVMYNRLYLPWPEHAQTNCSCFHSEAIWNYGRQLNGEKPITSGENINWEELMADPDNLWAPNSKEHAGFPPTPIANPGEAALAAAVSPEASNDLFFVTAFKDGSALFSETYAGHQDNIDIAEENGIQ